VNDEYRDIGSNHGSFIGQSKLNVE